MNIYICIYKYSYIYIYIHTHISAAKSRGPCKSGKSYRSALEGKEGKTHCACGEKTSDAATFFGGCKFGVICTERTCVLMIMAFCTPVTVYFSNLFSSQLGQPRVCHISCVGGVLRPLPAELPSELPKALLKMWGPRQPARAKAS